MSSDKSAPATKPATLTAQPGSLSRVALMSCKLWDVRENKPFTEGPNSGKKENWRQYLLFGIEEVIMTNSNGEKMSFPKLIKIKSHIRLEIGATMTAKVRVTSYDGNEFFTLESLIDEATADALRKAGVL